MAPAASSALAPDMRPFAQLRAAVTAGGAQHEVSLRGGEHLAVLLFLEVRRGLAVAAQAVGEARAPVPAAVAEYAVLADLVPVAVPKAGTCDPHPGSAIRTGSPLC